ncbi:hypothetical protein C0992_005645 [Termitomyces sp. T32_za158]|nr:hypothetical protein C0992_005645 [Termitomyces sp. T32_za158]
MVRQPNLWTMYFSPYAKIPAIETLKDPYTLPPKQLLFTTFIPSAWVDDTLINERKLGLTQYLEDLIKSPDYKDNSTLLHFLTDSKSLTIPKFHPKDEFSLILSRKEAFKSLSSPETGDRPSAATLIAGSYYPYWSAGSYPPEGLDFSKFDILFFGMSSPSASECSDSLSTGLQPSPLPVRHTD